MRQPVALFYLSPDPYGGWVTYTAHLVRALVAVGMEPTLYKVRPRYEGKARDFGYGLRYTNVDLPAVRAMRDRDPSLPMLIVALGKQYMEPGLELLAMGARIVLHDPTELNQRIRAAVEALPPVLVREGNLRHVPQGVYIPHPYAPKYGASHPNPTPWEHRPVHAVSTGRIDWDKFNILALDANRLLPPERRVRLHGFENRLYTKFHVLPRYPEWVQSQAAYPRTMYHAVELCREARYAVDLSASKGDGGGAQYTFLEAMDAGAVCVLNKRWTDVRPATMVPGLNCLQVRDGEELARLLREDTREPGRMAQLVQGGYGLLREHDPVAVGLQYRALLLSEPGGVQRASAKSFNVLELSGAVEAGHVLYPGNTSAGLREELVVLDDPQQASPPDASALAAWYEKVRAK